MTNFKFNKYSKVKLENKTINFQIKNLDSQYIDKKFVSKKKLIFGKLITLTGYNPRLSKKPLSRKVGVSGASQFIATYIAKVRGAKAKSSQVGLPKKISLLYIKLRELFLSPPKCYALVGLPLQSSFLPGNLNKITIAILIALFLCLVAFSYRFPSLHVADQLHLPWIKYVLSIWLIFVIGGIRSELKDQNISFSLKKYRWSLLFLLIVAVLDISGILPDIYSEIFSTLGCVLAGFSLPLSSEIKEIFFLKELRQVWNSSGLKELSSLNKIKFILSNLFKHFSVQEKSILLVGNKENLPTGLSGKKSVGLIPGSLNMEEQGGVGLRSGPSKDVAAPSNLGVRDFRGDSGLQLPSIDPTRESVPGQATLPPTPTPAGYMVSKNVIWDTIYTAAAEKTFRDKLVGQTDALITAHNILELNSRTDNVLHLSQMPLSNRALQHMAYLHDKTFGLGFTLEEFRETPNTYMLRKILNTEIKKSLSYLNKLENTNFQNYLSNPLFRELRVLETVLMDLKQRSNTSSVQSYTRDVTTRTLMINAYQADARTNSAQPLRTRNTHLTKTVLENRILVLRKQLHLD